MLNQTLLPREIILWLSKEQFPSAEDVPMSLRKLEGEIFKIRFVDGDIRSHKKYYYVAKDFPNDYVFLIDDDTYYASTLLHRTWEEHLKHPEAVICNYGYRMSYKTDGHIDNYNSWAECYEYSAEKNLFFGSGGGTLFRPIDLYKDLTNLDKAIELTPTADDIWLNAMTRLAGRNIVIMPNGLPLEFHSGERTLTIINKDEAGNDKQLYAIECFYNNEGKVVFNEQII